MKLDLILCPVDFSKCSQMAVELVGRLSAVGISTDQRKSRVILLNIIESGSEQDHANSLVDNMLNRGMTQLRDKGKFDPEVIVEYLTLKGNPSEAIVQFAKAKHADLIVMGTRGKSGIKKLLLGSVAEAVMRKASCPVITVNPP